MDRIRWLIACISFFDAVRGASWYSKNDVPLGDDRSDPIVSTTHGYLRGRWLSSTHGKTYAAFKGVPYAVPPLGDLRFEPPQEAEPWTGVRDALNHGAQCPQFLFVLNEYVGHEDCLLLNIYTPQHDSDEASFPIIFFVHGGGWVMGAGDADNYVYGPDHFMDEKVILVTMNYRLGALGFLHLENEIPGNMGLKDLRMALRWVNSNARSFGGDPNRIVLMGQSVGAAAIEYLTMDQESRSLISGAVAQSGSAFGVWAWAKPEALARRTRNLARLVKCRDTNSTELILRCLRDADARDLVQYQFFTDFSPLLSPAGFSFAPTTEPNGTLNPVIEDCTRNELGRMNYDRFGSLPYLTGFTTAEGIFFTKVLETQLNGVLHTLSRRMLRLPKQSSSYEYLRERPSLGRSEGTYFRSLWGNLLTAPVLRSARLRASAGANVYLYHFAFAGRNNFGRLIFDATEASHMDELTYLFRGRGLFDELSVIEEPSPEATLAKRLIRLWTNFAKTGNPTPYNDSEIELYWPPGPARSLVIGEDLSIGYPDLKNPLYDYDDLRCIL